MSALAAHQLSFSYPGGIRLRVPELTIAPGERVAVLGPSGGGKTTLLRLLTGLIKPEEGSVHLGEAELNTLTDEQRRHFRLTQTGLIFQDFGLLDYLTVKENILLPALFDNGRKACIEQARELARRLDILPLWRRQTERLSQGERQRVAIARALVHQPRFVFADEPTASLDRKCREQVMRLLIEYTEQRPASLIMVTHDAELLPFFSRHLSIEAFTA